MHKDEAEPCSAEYWDACELWPRDRLREFQLAYVYSSSPFYRKQWDEIGWNSADPRTLEGPGVPAVHAKGGLRRSARAASALGRPAGVRTGGRAPRPLLLWDDGAAHSQLLDRSGPRPMARCASQNDA